MKLYNIYLCTLIGVIALLCTSNVQAQSWAQRHGDEAEDQGKGIAVDGSGNVYVTGFFRDTAIFGDTTLVSSGQRDIFVAKYDSSGKVLWAHRAGGSAMDEGRDIAVDGSGNVYITGHFQGNVEFSGKVARSKDNNDDIFVAKYSSNGAVQWVVSAGSKDEDQAMSIAVDGSGNVYITGFFRNEAEFGRFKLNSNGGSKDIFIARYNSSGEVQWVFPIGSNSSDEGKGIVVDGSGYVYVAGYFKGNMVLGNLWDRDTLRSNGENDIFIAKYTSNNGELRWAKNAGGSSQDEGKDIVVDGGGNLYIAGFFGGTATFGDTTTLRSSGQSDIFIAKYNSNGILDWVKHAGGNSMDSATSIAIDNRANVYVTGLITSPAVFGRDTLKASTSFARGDVFVAKYSSNGTLLPPQRHGGTQADKGLGIAVDGKSNIYVTGYFTGTANFAGQDLRSQRNSQDIFIMKNLPIVSPTSSISGQITQNNGNGLWGVRVSLTGSRDTTVTTEINGYYNFEVTNGTYTITPSLSGFVFNPVNHRVTVTVANTDVRDQNFRASLQTYTISGVVNGSTTSGVMVNLLQNGTVVTNRITDVNGNYSFMVTNGTYTLEPSLKGYDFSPPSTTITIDNSNRTQNFIASVAVPTYTIKGVVSGVTQSGKVNLLQKNGITVATVATNSAGEYTFTGVTRGEYTISPCPSGLFIPKDTSITIDNNTLNLISDINFSRRNIEIRGKRTICQNEEDTYEVDNIEGMTYNWSTTGGDILQGQNTSRIDIVWQTIGQQIVEIILSSGGCSITTTVSVQVNQLPTLAIRGDKIVCNNTTTTYSVPNTIGSTYSWQVTGGTITSGDNTSTITVAWNTIGNGSVSVQEINGACSTTAVMSITVNALPAPYIIGDTTVCAYTTSTYSVNPISGHSYIWRVDGGTIQGATTGTSILVQWADENYAMITVEEISAQGCTSSTSQTVTIIEPSVLSIIGDTIVLQNTETKYSIKESGNWYVQDGTIISDSENTDSITIRWDNASTSATITVVGTASCIGSTTINIIIKPATLTIRLDSVVGFLNTEVVQRIHFRTENIPIDRLSSYPLEDILHLKYDANILFQGNKKSDSIEYRKDDGTYHRFIPIKISSADTTIEVRWYLAWGSSSRATVSLENTTFASVRVQGGSQAPITITNLPYLGGQPLFMELLAVLRKVSPNPTREHMRVSYDVLKATEVRLSLYNAIGELVRVVLQEERAAGSYEQEVELKGLPSGVYFMVLEAGGKRTSTPIELIK